MKFLWRSSLAFLQIIAHVILSGTSGIREPSPPPVVVNTSGVKVPRSTSVTRELCSRLFILLLLVIMIKIIIMMLIIIIAKVMTLIMIMTITKVMIIMMIITKVIIIVIIVSIAIARIIIMYR